MIYLQLFYEFFITGLFMFGGGLAAIPFLQQMGDRTGWFSTVELMNMIAVSEATPGPIGINLATYTGYTIAGVAGGIIATAGIVLPSVIIALIVARLLVRFKENTYVEAALYGLRPASLGLIAAAGVTVFFLVIFNTELRFTADSHLFIFQPLPLILAIVLFITTNIFKKIHPLAFLASSAIIGVIIL